MKAKRDFIMPTAPGGGKNDVCARFQLGLGCQSSPCCTLLAVETDAQGKLGWWGNGITAEAKTNYSRGCSVQPSRLGIWSY